ncbi:MAG: hypothetical protein ABR979_03560 [Halobacteriota archaeon]|jgi:hypothetical protein
MTKRRLLSLSATMIVAALLCSSVLATIHPAAATDVNASAPAQMQNTSTSTIADPQSQTLTIPLVPFQLIVANQTVSDPTSSGTSATVGASQPGGSVAPSADTTAGNAANPTDAVTTNVTQQTADNGSLAPIPVSAGGGGSGLILVISLSYGTAIVVLALMRYWSFSFDEGTESLSDLNNADVVYVPGSAYSTLENVEYRHTAEGP